MTTYTEDFNRGSLGTLAPNGATYINVVEANEDVATPTAIGFTFTVYLMVKSGSATTSWDWT